MRSEAPPLAMARLAMALWPYLLWLYLPRLYPLRLYPLRLYLLWQKPLVRSLHAFGSRGLDYDQRHGKVLDYGLIHPFASPSPSPLTAHRSPLTSHLSPSPSPERRLLEEGRRR